MRSRFNREHGAGREDSLSKPVVKFAWKTLAAVCMVGAAMWLGMIALASPAECHGCGGYCSIDQLVCPIGCSCNFVTSNCQ